MLTIRFDLFFLSLSISSTSHWLDLNCIVFVRGRFFFTFEAHSISELVNQIGVDWNVYSTDILSIFVIIFHMDSISTMLKSNSSDRVCFFFLQVLRSLLLEIEYYYGRGKKSHKKKRNKISHLLRCGCWSDFGLDVVRLNWKLQKKRNTVYSERCQIMIQISTVWCGFRMHSYYFDVIDQQRARGHGFINKQKKKKENNRQRNLLEWACVCVCLELRQ